VISLKYSMKEVTLFVSGNQEYFHQPVMVNQVLEGLAIHPGGWYIDCTVGEGGHSSLILKASSPGGHLLGIDRDPQALQIASKRLSNTDGHHQLVRGNFAQVFQIARENSFSPADGVLLDLGLSSLQLDAEERGFTFRKDQPLDMRFDPDDETTAAEIVNTHSGQDLADLLWRYGEERRSRTIARALVKNRPLRTTAELAQTVLRAVGSSHTRIHPATRTFQALRIAVNRELENLQNALPTIVNALRTGGRLVVISYHSLEDRIVKEFLREQTRKSSQATHEGTCAENGQPLFKQVQRKALKPSLEEIEQNRRSRSARLRVAERF